MISILTDFGLEDTYVAAMKAVIHAIAPSEVVLDLTHNIPPGDIRRGAVELWRVAHMLPEGSVVLGVVDPGVGTSRRAIAIHTGHLFCVGPDNGLFSYISQRHADESAVELTNSKYQLPEVSRTFHGRDIFAPAAAHIACGLPLDELGASVVDVQELSAPELNVQSEASVQGEILYADRFGNLVTSIGQLTRKARSLRLDPWIGGADPLELSIRDPYLTLPDGTPLPLVEAFADAPGNALTAYIGSAGLIEIAVNGGSAIERTGVQPGQTVELRTQG